MRNEGYLRILASLARHFKSLDIAANIPNGLYRDSLPSGASLTSDSNSRIHPYAIYRHLETNQRFGTKSGTTVGTDYYTTTIAVRVYAQVLATAEERASWLSGEVKYEALAAPKCTIELIKLGFPGIISQKEDDDLWFCEIRLNVNWNCEVEIRIPTP